MILCSPTEPRYIKDALQAVSTDDIERRLGADYVFSFGEGELAMDVSIQRKTLGPNGDMIPSLYSGLLACELTKMQATSIRFLIIEATQGLRWTSSGDLIQPHATGKPFNRDQLWPTLWSLKGGYGLEAVEWTLGERDTVAWILAKQKWFDRDKGGGSGVSIRKTKDMDWCRHVMQSIPGLGRKRVEAIIEHLKTPLRWDESLMTLESIPGVSRLLASKLRACLIPVENR